MRLFIFTLFIFIELSLFCQEITKKQLAASPILSNIKIDGVLDEDDWKLAERATDFTQIIPSTGEPSTQKTEVVILYDDEAIYVGAHMYDENPDSILKALSIRDDIGNADWFGFAIDAYQDGVNGVGFLVTASGVQFDAKYSANGGNGRGAMADNEDSNWDAVWDSATQLNDEGWIAEFKIPFSALRFPNQKEQKWNINFARMIRRTREGSWWNEVKPDVNGFFNQAGELIGINDIESPVRLQLTPYVSANYTSYEDSENPEDDGNNWQFNGGMDLKYGLNDAFTLDMTLVPDFGQVVSDNQVLNLTPFEVRFDENRPFFTEGIELFSKANLFYSRRIGGTPVKFYDVESEINTDDEEIENNPSTTRLINATKVSGRTKKNLGIGFFNSVTALSEATIINKETNKKRNITTNPLTNYNILVFDQALKNNSFISLINTNVTRRGSFYDANVTGMEFQVQNKANTFQMNGRAAVSQIYENGEVDLGHTYNFNIGKTGGNFNYGLRYILESSTYNPNDLGFLFNNNERTAVAYARYNIYEPFWRFNRIFTGGSVYYSRLQDPNKFVNFGFDGYARFIWQNFFASGVWFNVEPTDIYDYFEPRTDGRYYLFPSSGNIGGWISSDYRKRFALDVETNYRNFEGTRSRFNLSVSPRFRVNDQIMLILRMNRFDWRDEEGYVSVDSDHFETDDIMFGVRDVLTYDQVLTLDYIFTNRMGLNFRLRHYWSRATYSDYKTLDLEGTLSDTEYTGFDENNVSLHNTSANFFNIDMVYTWRFAPGSDLSVGWKKAIATFDENVDISYMDNSRNLFDAPNSDNFSVKVVFFLDYLYLRRL